MVLVCILVFVAGFGLGRMSDGIPADIIRDSQVDANVTPNESDSQASENTNTEGGATVDTNNLTDGQRNMIEAMGIDADSVTITPEMIACAEAKLGAARLEEIKNGATPSFTEGASLVACYR